MFYRGRLSGTPVLQFFLWADLTQYDSAKLKNADKKTNIGMLKKRYEYYGQHIVKRILSRPFSRV
ncbi:YcjX family protein [Enterobacter hormaechei]